MTILESLQNSQFIPLRHIARALAWLIEAPSGFLGKAQKRRHVAQSNLA